jgi:hypothetical protein
MPARKFCTNFRKLREGVEFECLGHPAFMQHPDTKQSNTGVWQNANVAALPGVGGGSGTRRLQASTSTGSPNVGAVHLKELKRLLLPSAADGDG